MLVLGRIVGESIMIGDDVKITIVDAGHKRVKLGIEAPPEIVVHRLEIFEKIKDQEKQEQPCAK